MTVFDCISGNIYLLTGRVDPDQEMIDLRMNAVKHKILILSGKGGARL